VDLMNLPAASAIFGLVIVALGAEIPDGVNAITISRRGFGGMAISACLGAQVINICLGLGLPWLIASLSGAKVPVSSTSFFVHEASLVLLMDVILFVAVTTLIPGRSSSSEETAELSGKKSNVLIVWYCATIAYLGISTLSPTIRSFR
jgi:Ca2+/Na+ antiporter